MKNLIFSMLTILLFGATIPTSSVARMGGDGIGDGDIGFISHLDSMESLESCPHGQAEEEIWENAIDDWNAENHCLEEEQEML